MQGMGGQQFMMSPQQKPGQPGGNNNSNNMASMDPASLSFLASSGKWKSDYC